jgi:5S rRNA maturation endonuclease (ribonuclease M5)
MAAFCDMIVQSYKEIIILTDWDRRGGYLCHTIKRNIQSTVKSNLLFREKIAKKASIKTVEGLPSWLETLREKNNHT